MKIIILFAALFFSHLAMSQDEDIVAIIDDLTAKWDAEALKMKTYDGLKDYCKIKPYRDKTVKLLNKIHHYDTTLYEIVTSKYDTNKDSEAKATIDDIETLEIQYTTKLFLKFLHQECNRFNEIENNLKRKGGSEYEKEVKALEKELSKYVLAITKRIDVIDEHVHHLKGLNSK
ncbi:MAG: hypothetical protein KI790_18495 [Cyclobacteriaceae bacterium]|nr:hypothetical protein [Cyclobacteriaceae bacterium HetDA_MAG_MS6]